LTDRLRWLSWIALAGCSGGLALPTAEGDLPEFGLRSAAFAGGAEIPRRHTCDGADVSPPLAWDAPPSGTDSFALAVLDPDAPKGPAVHWTAWNLDGGYRELPEGIALEEAMPPPIQGPTYTGDPGWHGPCPPPGDEAHAYEFRLWAVSGTLDPQSVDAEADVEALFRALDGRVLGLGTLTGTYGR
jgi:Raf kinase inhibitor-like YbhB/YbcL family protein